MTDPAHEVWLDQEEDVTHDNQPMDEESDDWGDGALPELEEGNKPDAMQQQTVIK